MRRIVRRLLLASSIALAGQTVSACGGAGPSTLVENVDSRLMVTSEGDFAALMAEGDARWANRLELSELQAAIAAWEMALTVPTPEGESRTAALYPALWRLARANYWHGHAFIRFDVMNDVEGADAALLAAYEQGVEYASLALAASNPEWTRLLQMQTPVVDAIPVLTPNDVDAMYWYASNLGRYGLVRGITTVLARVDEIRTMMEYVQTYDATYYFGAPDRYFGVYYTKLPFPGGNPTEAERRFQSAIANYPEYLETRVLYGEDFAQALQRRDIAEEQLQYVVDADLNALPAVLLPENTIAQRRAQWLLDNLDENFR
jgi:hypothetical protein